MNTPENTTPAAQPEERKSKRRAILAFGLAALAIGGIGAAATSAAWTDNVFFSAAAEAATFDLQGSIDGTTWKQSATDDGTIELTVDPAAFANLLPGQSRSVDLWVRNEGSVKAALQTTVTWKSSTFAQNPTAEVQDLVSTLTAKSTPGASDKFQLTVTAPDEWLETNKGKTGTIVVKIAGTATAP